MNHQPPESASTGLAPLPQVLIIDDDQEFCALIQEYLSDCGYQVAAAHTGPDGVAMVAAGSWHGVILDVMLPGAHPRFSRLRRSDSVEARAREMVCP